MVYYDPSILEWCFLFVFQCVCNIPTILLLQSTSSVFFSLWLRLRFKNFNDVSKENWRIFFGVIGSIWAVINIAFGISIWLVVREGLRDSGIPDEGTPLNTTPEDPSWTFGFMISSFLAIAFACLFSVVFGYHYKPRWLAPFFLLLETMCAIVATVFAFGITLVAGGIMLIYVVPLVIFLIIIFIFSQRIKSVDDVLSKDPLALLLDYINKETNTKQNVIPEFYEKTSLLQTPGQFPNTINISENDTSSESEGVYEENPFTEQANNYMPIKPTTRTTGAQYIEQFREQSKPIVRPSFINKETSKSKLQDNSFQSVEPIEPQLSIKSGEFSLPFTKQE